MSVFTNRNFKLRLYIYKIKGVNNEKTIRKGTITLYTFSNRK